MSTFRLTLEYDGTDFAGWQSQSQGERTVQGTLAAALAEIAGQAVRVTGAGRTDAGVHAEGQVAPITLATRLDADTLARALNAKLPDDLAVVAVAPAADDFDPRREATSKLYRYAIWNGALPSPLRRRRSYHVREPLDEAAMRSAGYKGRVALYEIMPIKDEIRELILQGASVLELKKQAVSLGMKTLRTSGLLKIKEGMTSLEEVRENTFSDNQ